jgi:glycosyltransferase involved in cell wall biosynthesis
VPRRILHLSNSSYRSLAEAGPTYPILRELASGADEYHVLAQNVRRRFSTDRERNLFLHLIPALSGREFFFLSSFAVYLVRKHHIDGILCQDPVLGGVAGAEAARVHRIPLMAELHSDVYFGYLEKGNAFQRGVGRLARRVLRQAAVVRVTGPTLMRRLAEIGVDPSRMALIPYRVDTDFFRPTEDERSTTRRRLGFGDEVVIVSVGRFVPQKGYLELISAFATVLAQEPNARLVLAGGGPLQGEYAAAVARLGVGQAVRLLPWISRDEQLGLLAAADVYTQPSRPGHGEWMPRALLEAMAMGLPVLATSAGGMIDVVRENETGVIVRPMDAESLTAGLLTLVSNAQLRRSLGRAGRIDAETHYGWHRNFERYRHALYSMAV